MQDEIAPIEVKVKRSKVMMDFDEHPKPKTTIEGLAKLPTVFKKVLQIHVDHFKYYST